MSEPRYWAPAVLKAQDKIAETFAVFTLRIPENKRADFFEGDWLFEFIRELERVRGRKA